MDESKEGSLRDAFIGRAEGEFQAQPTCGKRLDNIPKWEYRFRMTVKTFHLLLQSHPKALPRFTLPDGDQIPAHFHVTEVGYVRKKFIDCGGVTGESETCVLQTWLGEDLDHRLTAGRLAKILMLGDRVLPTKDIDVEVEYDCCVVGQYPIAEVKKAGAYLDIGLVNKQTQCLARERRNAEKEVNCCEGAATCC
jgi:uncharacterized protein DUF6428